MLLQVSNLMKSRSDVPDFKKGMKVKIYGGEDIWTVLKDGDEDDILLVNTKDVVISCDYARLVIVSGN